MKNFKKLQLTTLIIIAVSMYSCENQDDFSFQTEESVSEIDTSELINFKGLSVNHRFATPIKYLEIKHTEEVLKEMYNTSKHAVAQRKGMASSTDIAELPNVALIVEATKKNLNLFPYKEIQEELEEQATEKLSSIELLKIERHKQIEAEKEDQEHLAMIKQDFPTLTEAEIEKNIDLIDEYYSQNLDYVVLNETAENEDVLTGKVAARSASCVFSRIVGFRWGFARATYAMVLASTRASTSAGNYYPDSPGSYNGYVGGGGTNTRGDAYRHILWNALLANYYYTIRSKTKRINFAKAVADANEQCNTTNPIDSEAMDYHNNFIGRKIWNDNTSYRRNWFGWIYGLNTPSTSRLKRLVRYAVNRESCFLVKIKRNDRFPANLLTQNKTAAQIKAKILSTDSNTAVYFQGTIAPSWNEERSHRSSHEYYDFDDVSSYKNREINRDNIPCYEL